MARNSNQYREDGGMQEAMDRFVRFIKDRARDEVEGTTVRRATHLQGNGEISRQEMLNALHSPLSSAVRVNTNESPPTFYFMVGVDSLSDDVVLG